MWFSNLISPYSSSKKRFLFFSLVFLGVIAILVLWPRPERKVGRWAIEKKDIEYRDAIAKSFFPNARVGTGLLQLERSAKHLKVLENNGVTITREEILQEAQRIERSSRDPEHLKKIKNIFQGDHEAYLKNYVLPTLVDRVIAFEFFPNNPKIHQESLAKALSLIEQSIDNPKTFKSTAKNLKVPVKEVLLSLKKGLIWPNSRSMDKEKSLVDLSPKKNPQLYARVQSLLANKGQGSAEAQAWYERFVQNKKPGEIISKPVNYNDRWLIIKYMGPSDSENYSLQVAEVAKIEYGEWLNQELKKIRD